MRLHRTLCLITVLALPMVSQASNPRYAAESPYVADQSQPIKALAPARVEGLLAGQGLGYAKAAELNGYPGPKHVLELAEPLQLSDSQRQQTEALFRRMALTAKALGGELVEAEAELDRRFAERAISESELAERLLQIGTLEARLRTVHLQAHLEQTRILDEGQRERYGALRGYHAQDQDADAEGSRPHQHQHQH